MATLKHQTQAALNQLASDAADPDIRELSAALADLAKVLIRDMDEIKREINQVHQAVSRLR